MSLALQVAGRDSAAAQARVDQLAGAVAARISGSPEADLRACGTVLRGNLMVDASASAASFDVDAVLQRRSGAPLVLGAIAVAVARQAGVPLGLMAGRGGRFAVAHATLAKPLALDCAAPFALVDLAGEESTFRWMCAHQTAHRLSARLGQTGPETTKGPAGAEPFAFSR